MKSKQVIAWLMAATLAVTGSGVTTLAGQNSVSEEAVVLEASDFMKLSMNSEANEANAKVEVVDAGKDAENKITCTTDDKVQVKAKFTKPASAVYREDSDIFLEVVSMSATAQQAKVHEGVRVDGCSQKVTLNEKGEFETTFTFTPEEGKYYYVRGVYVLGESGKNTQKCRGAEIYLNLSKVEKEQVAFFQELKAQGKVPVFPTVKIPGNAEADKKKPEAIKEITDAIEKANKAMEASGEGTWSVENAAKEVELDKGNKKLKLTFTSEKYTFTESATFDQEFDIKVVYLTSGVKVKKGGEEISVPQTLLLNGSVKLTAEFEGDTSATATAPNAVQWTISPEDQAYIEIANNQDGTATLRGLKETEDGKTVKIRVAAADNPEVAYTDLTFAVKKGVTTKAVQDSFAKYKAEFEKGFAYDGAETISDHFQYVLDELNDKEKNELAKFGTYSFDTTGGKTTTNVAVGENKATLLYTTNEGTELESKVSPWEEVAKDKQYKLTSDQYTVPVTKQQIDSTNILQKIGVKENSTYVIGATLNNIYTPSLTNAIFAIEWVGKNEKGEFTSTVKPAAASTTVKTLGKLQDYALAIKLKDATKYELPGADSTGYIYKQPNVTIVAPEFLLKKADTKVTDKYTAGSDIELKVAKPDLKYADSYYTINYEWYRKGDGKDTLVTTDTTKGTDKITITTIEGSTLKIEKVTEASEGDYYCVAKATLKDASSIPALKDDYRELKTNQVDFKVETSGIKFEVDTTEVEGTYGDSTNENLKVGATITASDITKYSIAYCEADEDGNDLSSERKNVELDHYLLQNGTEAEQQVFSSGHKIEQDLRKLNLETGSYNFYITVEAKKESGTDSNTYGPIKVTIEPKQIETAKLEEAKLSAALTYGQNLADAEITYSGAEKDNVTFTSASEGKAQKAGEQEIQVSVQAANKNYTLDKEKTFQVQAKVKKAPLVLKAKNLSIEEGTKPELSYEEPVLVNDDKLADVVTVTLSVVDSSGNSVTDLSTLKAGGYEIIVKAELLSENYDVVTEKGILNVTAKAAEQKPDNDTPGNNQGNNNQGNNNTPGVNTPGTNTPGTQDPGTNNTPGTNTPDNNQGTNTPGTEEKVTVKSVDVTLNGQSLSGTVKAKTKATYNLKASVTLSNGKKASSVKWKSSNTKIAKVSSKGVVKVQNKTGKVKITATYSDGNASKSKTITLNVAKANVKAAKLAITGKKTMKAKKSQTLQVTVSPATVTNGKVTWKTSNKKIATVSSKGVVKALKKGKVTITATAKDGSKKKASFKITVK